MNPPIKDIIIIIMAPQPLLGLGRLFSFLILYTVGMTPQTGYMPVVMPLTTHTTKETQTFMPCMGFEPTTLVFERAYTIHAKTVRLLLYNNFLLDQDCGTSQTVEMSMEQWQKYDL
jgi:hypothetical protein